LTGVRLVGGVDFTFPATTLAPGERVVVASDLDAFQALYGRAIPVAGQFSGQLSNGGEELELLLPAPYAAAILRFAYEDAWYALADGGGSSLVVRSLDAEAAAWSTPDHWRPSPQSGGSPGRGELSPQSGDIDGNGAVDANDLASWAAAFGQSASRLPAADLNWNGMVDAADYVLWRKHASGPDAAAAVPADAADVAEIGDARAPHDRCAARREDGVPRAVERAFADLYGGPPSRSLARDDQIYDDFPPGI
jgi:hypothetical protein